MPEIIAKYRITKDIHELNVDFLLQFDRFVIPIEIKSGKSGTLRSLHQFINRCDHSLAIRLFSGPLQIENTKTPEGKSYHLLNLPYFLAGRLKDYIAWFIENVKN